MDRSSGLQSEELESIFLKQFLQYKDKMLEFIKVSTVRQEAVALDMAEILELLQLEHSEEAQEMT